MMVVCVLIDGTYIITFDIRYRYWLIVAEMTAIILFLYAKYIQTKLSDMSHLLAHMILSCTHFIMINTFRGKLKC